MEAESLVGVLHASEWFFNNASGRTLYWWKAVVLENKNKVLRTKE